MGNTLSGLWSVQRSAVWVYAILLVCLVAAFSHAQGGFELRALSVQADQMKARLDKNPSDYEALRSLGTAYHYMAVKDSAAYAKKAVQVLERAQEQNPEDYEVLCCLGDAYVLLAKDGGDGMARATNANKGFEYMDKAVRRAPDDILIRLTRGYSAKSTPRPLNRRSIAYDDFEHLAMLFEKEVKAPLLLKASVYRTLAGLHKEDGDGAKAQRYQAMAEKGGKGE